MAFWRWLVSLFGQKPDAQATGDDSYRDHKQENRHQLDATATSAGHAAESGIPGLPAIG
jgi:hypothetical protein